MSRRGRTDLSGVLLVDKAAGMTSHDVVSVVRRATGEGRVGHAGTLDPMATGLLLILIGPSTRLATYLTAATKRYTARIVFGSSTDTDDAEGTVLRRAPVPEELANEEYARAQIAALVGGHDQVPPDVSAIKRGGVTAYRAARAGKKLDLDARAVTVSTAELLGIARDVDEDGELTVAWDIDVTVSKGTYIRAIARDLGPALGTLGHLGALRRTRSGILDVADAVPVDALREMSADAIRDRFIDPLTALEMPVVVLPPEHIPRATVGARIPVEAMSEPVPQDTLVALTAGEGLIGIFQRKDKALVPRTVLGGPAQ